MAADLDVLSIVREWLTWMDETRGRSYGTVVQYRQIMRSYVRDVVRTTFDDVSPQVIERWLQRPREGRAKGQTASAATQGRDASCLRSFYEWAIANGYARTNPAKLVCTPTIRNRQPRPISDAAWLRLWSGSTTEDAVALGLMFFCGLRRSELVRLRVSHVDLGGGRLVNFMRKGGGEDVLPIGTMLAVFERRLPHLDALPLWDCVREMCERRRVGSDWLLGWEDLGKPRDSVAASFREAGQLDPHHVNHWLDRKCVATQVRHLTPHQFRHSCATNLIRSGVPIPMVSTLLNHASIATTMRYVKAGGDELAEWLRSA